VLLRGQQASEYVPIDEWQAEARKVAFGELERLQQSYRFAAETRTDDAEGLRKASEEVFARYASENPEATGPADLSVRQLVRLVSDLETALEAVINAEVEGLAESAAAPAEPAPLDPAVDGDELHREALGRLLDEGKPTTGAPKAEPEAPADAPRRRKPARRAPRKKADK